MDTRRSLLVLVSILVCLPAVTPSFGCLCGRFDWSPWSPCTKTCNYGTQQRERAKLYQRKPTESENLWMHNLYLWFWCHRDCYTVETRSCNEQMCPINCKLGDYGGWSECSPCAKQKFKKRSLDTPAQFGGEDCGDNTPSTRNCNPSTKCRIEPIDCKDKFKCTNGRCISSVLQCNTQNDCGDRSDEADCDDPVTPVCRKSDLQPAYGANRLANGFNFLTGESKAAVLDNMFMGSECVLNHTVGTGNRVFFRVPANFKSYDLKVSVPEDFKKEPQPVASQVVDMAEFMKESVGKTDSRDGNFMMFPILFVASSKSRSSRTTSYKEAIRSSKKTDSQLIRIHQVLPISRFEMKDKDLFLSQPFLEFLHQLPIDYNYALYSELFQLYGTHYYTAGTLGGHYDLLYMYNREEIKQSGESTEHVAGCLNEESYLNVLIFYSEKTNVQTCSNNLVNEKYSGSYIRASEKSFSTVRGGRSEEAGALAWERKGTAATSDTYSNWVGSVIDNPALVDYELSPIIDLVRGIPCAVTKRRHLRRALLEYQRDFDSCMCSPCPNNALAVLQGTACSCVCKTGTYGPNCETQAPDYKPVGVDGSWSCWGPWSPCLSFNKRHRTRRCNNPAPLAGGKPCSGDTKQTEGCFVSVFPGEDVCINDEDFNEEGQQEGLPPGVEGCVRPKSPDRSFLRKDKRYYLYGEEEEFLCYRGYELEGYPLITCRPGGEWTQPKGECLRNLCDPPEVSEEMTLFPLKEIYKEGQVVGFNCKSSGLIPSFSGVSTCTLNRPVFTWDPPIPSNIVCKDENPFIPDFECKRGEKMEGSKCVCVPRGSCLQYTPDHCVLNTVVDKALMLSECDLTAGVCHGDPLFLVNAGPCPDEAGLAWARFRANMSAISAVKEVCGVDTCYEWESCESKKCVCKDYKECGKDEGRMFCVNLLRFNRKRSMNLCAMAATKCAKTDMEVVNEGPCV
ncbi:complement component C6-like [Osmerus eperlanus]|uniref:complement component C6-like n=1 Tax=Osmerus eperlanus TaxID=29151 RepID=UPI002E126D87